MSKKNKLFSWLGLGKAQQPQAEASDDTASNVSQPAIAEPVAAESTDSVATTSTTEPIVVDADIAPVSPAVAPLSSAAAQPEAAQVSAPAVTTSAAPVQKTGFFARLKQGLAKTSQNLGSGLASLFSGRKIDEELYEELETQLLLADVGVETTQKLIRQLEQHADRKSLKDSSLLFDKLQQDMAVLLQDVEQPLQPVNPQGPFVILMVGVNGVGKTTTIGKMAQQFKQQGKTVMLAAGDTFRAAAVEQLQVWGERNNIAVVAQHTGADSASVIFDAYQAAKARKVDVLIADTAGRLQNKAHLMEELKKIVRVLQKIDVNAPHEVMLTLDAGTGQNALSQAKVFNEAVQLTGISLTKLDGTAKGGVIFAIADQFKVPLRYIGVGEGIDDLRVFNSQDFIRALFNRES
ncbi:MAG: signal recognition particle-docking protein FtsY [Gammaproteobacteria bacterium]|nr:signal recognition particle-docking protein FtsY [Gammaproteobacteria bacterium]MBU1555231.1 signal recognition particle-docking protein FtsY [Gammaproteobacteria bacterium]MBU2070102.1 signal recognition particle-docking protein FtsY [Gammaproteobacteria bacterium]MBU2183602.1 signal recognition particle-docking protein FtsY [Gammaproteobacteria bacterium]MBU2205636.1 signal recognition particle-docking protein FtsY [Gammaproteobacteria bacterium]